jgi:phosphatidylglycerophosphate synthase
MMSKDFIEEKYFQFAKLRDVYLKPLAKILTWLGISASGVSYSGIFLMSGFILMVRFNRKTALFFLLLAIGMDFVDGVVARYQHQASDRGKFVDMVADNIIFSFYVIGVSHAELLPSLWALLLVYVMVLTKLFRVIYNAFNYQSDWFFKSLAGFLPNFICGICYLVFAVLLIFKINLFTPCFIGSIIVLCFDATAHFVLIIRKKIKS